MTAAERIRAYLNQTGRPSLTARQRRRIVKHHRRSNRPVAAVDLGDILSGRYPVVTS